MTPCSRYASRPQTGRGGSVDVDALSQIWIVRAAGSEGSVARCLRAGSSLSAMAGPAKRRRTGSPPTHSQTSSHPPAARAASSPTSLSCAARRSRPSRLWRVEPSVPGSGLTGPAGLVDFMDRVEQQELLHVGVRAELGC